MTKHETYMEILEERKEQEEYWREMELKLIQFQRAIDKMQSILQTSFQDLQERKREAKTWRKEDLG